jgi:hypothetical protein
MWVGGIGSVPVRVISAFVVAAIVVSVIPILARSAVPLPLLAGSSSSEATAPATILLTRENIQTGGGLTITSVLDVRSQAELIDYAQSLMRDDQSIVSIELQEGSVAMTYRHDTEVLRMRTISTETRAAISADGSVMLTRPWYESLFGAVANADATDYGFSDIAIETDSAGTMNPESAARLLSRMQGRFQIGAL